MSYKNCSLFFSILFFVLAIVLMIVSGFSHDNNRVNNNWCYDPFNLHECFRSRACNSMTWNQDNDFVKYGCLWNQKRESRIIRYNHNGATASSVTESSTIAEGCAYYQYTCDRSFSNSECLVQNDATLKYIHSDDRDRICEQLQDREADMTHSTWYIIQIVSIWMYMLGILGLALYGYFVCFPRGKQDNTFSNTIPVSKESNIKYSKILKL